MMRFMVLVVLLLCGPTALADDWPHWLGPHRDASTSETVPPWKEPPRVLWRRPVGEGNSSPVIVGGRVFLHTKLRDKALEDVTAYDIESGNALWRTSYERGNFTSPYGNGPRATPAVVGDKVFAYGISGILTCLDAGDGHKVWQVDTWKEFKPPHLMFGVSCSPLVLSDRVYLMVGGKGSGVVAFDIANGGIAWKRLDDGPSYSSPSCFGTGRREQLVFLTQAGLVSLEPASGKGLWRFPFRDTLLESSATPLHTGDMVIASSITLGSAGLDLATVKGTGQLAVTPRWKNPELTSYFSTPVAVGKEHFYVVTGTNPLSVLNPLAKKKPSATLNCVATESGKVLWKRPNVGTYHASLLRTGDNKLLMLEEAGNLVLLDPNPKEYRELARAKVCGHTWAHPAFANGRIYIRDDQELICLQMSE
jgi:outer membrane protein assembly factor BamB